MEGFARFLALLFVITLVVAVVVVVENFPGDVETRRLEAEAQKARADADRIAAAVELAEAQAEVETARGERAVLEAAARAVDSDRQLVQWYTLRGDVRVVVMLASLLATGVMCAVLVIVVGRRRDERIL